VSAETERERQERIDRTEDLRGKAQQIKEDGFFPWEADYWNDRYEMEENDAKDRGDSVIPFEWYQPPEALMSILSGLIKPLIKPKVLIVGCGNSRLGEVLYDKGVFDITNIDFSDVVISQMEEKYGAEKDGMKWACMNARDMNKQICPDDTFDVVIDKACLDCNMSGPGSARNSDSVLFQISRVLKAMGVLISISFAKPETRLPLFEKPGYKFEITDKKAIPKPTINATDIPDSQNPHYVYVMTKKF